MPSNYFALIIATAEYEDKGFQRLRSPTTDAHTLEDVLRDPQIGGYQLDSLVNQPAYRANEEIENFFKDRNLDDQLLLYFSCHGMKDDRGRLYLTSSNTKVDRLASTGISSEFISDQMYGCRARNIILMLDCCYSGAFMRGLRRRAGEKVDLETFAGNGRAILSASSAMEYAFEIDGDAVDGTGISSLFTRTVVHALRTGEADLDGDGVVSVDELYDYVLDQLRKTNSRQTPTKLIDTEGTIYIARSIKAKSELGALSREIRTALSSPLVGVRKGIVEELEPLLTADHENERQAARSALLQLSKDESDRVAAAAAAALEVRPVQENVINDMPRDTTERTRALGGAVRTESAHIGGEQSVTYPPPAQGSSASAMAEWVKKRAFPTTRWRAGYDQEEVDIFLEAVRTTFLGRRKPPVTAEEVRNIQFTSTLMRVGYSQVEVDKFLDQVELTLASLATPVLDTSQNLEITSSDFSKAVNEITIIATAVIQKLTEVFGRLSVKSATAVGQYSGRHTHFDAAVRLPERNTLYFDIRYATTPSSASRRITGLLTTLDKKISTVGGRGVLVLIVSDSFIPEKVWEWSHEAEKLVPGYASVPTVYVGKFSDFLALPAGDFVNQVVPHDLGFLGKPPIHLRDRRIE